MFLKIYVNLINYICNKKKIEVRVSNQDFEEINTMSLPDNRSENNRYYSRGTERAYSIENKKKHRCNGELSLHVLDIIQSIMKASVTGKKHKIKTTCKIPKKFTQKEIKKILK